VAQNFINAFGEALEGLRKVFLAPSGQPFIVAGSGTLAMDMVAANLIEPNDSVLVVNTGYFSDRFAKIFERYGAHVTHVHGKGPGDAPTLEEVASALKSIRPAFLSITHVDTSTGVSVEVKSLAVLGRQYDAFVLVDGVCSLAGEEVRQDEWGIDATLTASQKAIGLPPGLALAVVSPRALQKFRNRATPVGNFYADWNEWLPIMEAYEARKPSYFGTPAVNLVWALRVSLQQILDEGMDARFARHRKLSQAFRAGMDALGLKHVPMRPELSATTMSAIYYPEGVNSRLVKAIEEEGVIVAGGLHPAIKTQYFRVGHMGSVSASDIVSTLAAIESGLAKCGYTSMPGVAVAAAQKSLTI
jgi:alanine-glyoxylate transaminase/serine-glyoxylate transaminase/serine-pyruvate transaminase